MVTLKTETMTRVHCVYLMRCLAKSTLAKLALATGLLGLASFWVSLKNVYHNAPALSNPTGFLGYSTGAFIHTELIVKVMMITLLYLGWILGLDILKNNWRLISKIRLISIHSVRP